MQEFRVGDVLSRSFSVWLKNFIPFTFLVLVVHVPIIIYTLWLIGGDLTDRNVATWEYITTYGSMFLEIIASAAVVYGVFMQLKGNHASLGDCVVVGLKRLFPALAVGILATLCMALGYVLLIIPGIIVTLMLYVAVPVAVVERPGIIASLQRSSELTNGCKWKIFAILIVVVLFSVLVHFLVESLFFSTINTVTQVKTYIIAVQGVDVLLGALNAVVSAVIYHDLRLSKDGVDIEELVRVFD